MLQYGGHVWLLTMWEVWLTDRGSAFTFYLMLANLHLNGHLCLGAASLDSIGVDWRAMKVPQVGKHSLVLV